MKPAFFNVLSFWYIGYNTSFKMFLGMRLSQGKLNNFFYGAIFSTRAFSQNTNEQTKDLKLILFIF